MEPTTGPIRGLAAEYIVGENIRVLPFVVAYIQGFEIYEDYETVSNKPALYQGT